jgi:Fic family protein
MRKTGYYEQVGGNQHFMPNPLPPYDPPFVLDAEMTALYGEAMLQLGKLNGMVHRLPDVKQFIRAYVIKEALLSSAIEGINTTMLEVFTQPLLAAKPTKSTQLVMNYMEAFYAALRMIRVDHMPIASRVILAAHKVLMASGEGDKADPGSYRKLSVKVGNLIPPPGKQVPNLMADLERYINNEEDSLPLLVRAGLVHVQFETIHPFLDGNGRIGRLLIILMLVEGNLLNEPILYLSYYFKKHHAHYYQWLDKVRTEGDFEGWIRFYLMAIRDSSDDAYRRAKDLELLVKELSERCAEPSDKQALAILFAFPVISIKELASQLGKSYNTAHKIILHFVDQGLLVEETQQKRGKLFTFKPYFEVLEREY